MKTMDKIFLVMPLAFVCEFIDSSLGTGQSLPFFATKLGKVVGNK